jgi:hypothetical protein
MPPSTHVIFRRRNRSMIKSARITAMLVALTAAMMPTASSAYELIAHRGVYHDIERQTARVAGSA